MHKEKLGENEINLSHDLSGRKNVRKERLEVHEGLYQKSIILHNLKTA